MSLGDAVTAVKMSTSEYSAFLLSNAYSSLITAAKTLYSLITGKQAQKYTLKYPKGEIVTQVQQQGVLLYLAPHFTHKTTFLLLLLTERDRKHIHPLATAIISYKGVS